jgi:hypothetical protein
LAIHDADVNAGLAHHEAVAVGLEFDQPVIAARRLGRVMLAQSRND